MRLFERPFDKDAKEPWSIPISLFKSFKDDNDATEEKCFEADWKLVKCPVKDDDVKKELKKKLRVGYHIIRNSYKYLAAVGTGTGGGAWYINLNTYTEFIK